LGAKTSLSSFFFSPPHSNEFRIFILFKHRTLYLFCPIAMSSDESQGYPIRRNNSCSAGELVCGRTWGTFYACCPSRYSRCFHSTKINNFICCPNNLDCTDSLEYPNCAGTSWDLYNSTGYFCCEPNQAGFSIEGTSSVGCLNPGAARNSSYNVLTPSSMGQWLLYCHTVLVANVRFGQALLPPLQLPRLLVSLHHP
jgi:hypothetical protein